MGAGAAAAALVGFAATLCTVGYLQMTTVDYWALFPPDPGPWCERDHPHSFLREPSNALSDFGYLAVGLAILVQVAQSRGRPYGRFSAFPEVGILAGVSNILHACGTFTNHACRCYMGHVWDVAGMYAAVWYLVCLCAGRFMYARLISQANPSSEGLIGAITQLRKMFVVSAVFTSSSGRCRCVSKQLLPTVVSLAAVSRPFPSPQLLYVGGCMLWYSLSQLRYTDPRCHPRENLIVTSMVSFGSPGPRHACGPCEIACVQAPRELGVSPTHSLRLTRLAPAAV